MGGVTFFSARVGIGVEAVAVAAVVAVKAVFCRGGVVVLAVLGGVSSFLATSLV